MTSCRRRCRSSRPRRAPTRSPRPRRARRAPRPTPPPPTRPDTTSTDQTQTQGPASAGATTTQAQPQAPAASGTGGAGTGTTGGTHRRHPLGRDQHGQRQRWHRRRVAGRVQPVLQGQPGRLLVGLGGERATTRACTSRAPTSDPDPIEQVRVWLAAAREAGIYEPEAMTLVDGRRRRAAEARATCCCAGSTSAASASTPTTARPRRASWTRTPTRR